MNKSEEFAIRQRIDELEKAIKRDPKGDHSNVDRRERELENLKEKLK